MFKKILVTGAAGFIGSNLVAHLRSMSGIDVLEYKSSSTYEELEQYIVESDFIFHLAGVNRPEKAIEFDKGNYLFTEYILRLLRKFNKKTPFLLSSSIQAALDSPYGASKKRAENAAFEWGIESNSPVFVFRLPNVFGKWCKPNYNSVVANFCYNTANNLPIRIDNEEVEIKLAYVDDVMEAFLSALDMNLLPDPDGYCNVGRTFSITLGNLANKILLFQNFRKNLIVPNLENVFDKFLYTTFMSYIPVHEYMESLEIKKDNRGWLTEFVKSKSSGQIFISRTKQGVTRGRHWHHTKIEKFVVIDGQATIKLRQINSNEVLEFNVSGTEIKVVNIPVGYTHSITNTGDTDLLTLFWANEIFDPDKPDTYFLEVD